MIKIKSFINVATPLVGNEEIEAVAEVLRSGYYVQGPKVKQFEQDFAKYIGTTQAIATNSGTSALHIAIAAAGIGPGDEVIVPAITFFSTVTSVIHNNAIPIFADIDREIFCLSPEDMEKRITEKTKAVIPVHFYGHPAEMDSIMKIAKAHDLIVIEDCAQAHGAEYKGKKVGSIGHMGCWSFYATKNITTGEGGMITTNDPSFEQTARVIRNHGMTSRDDHSILGYNYRMNEISAAIGIVQLPKLDKFNEIRSKNSMYLIKGLEGVDWIELPVIKPYIKHAFFWCPIQVKEDKLGMKTKDLITKLRDNGVEVRHRYIAPLYKQPMLLNQKAYTKGCPFSCPFYGKDIDYSQINCPNTEKIAGKMIGLPNHPKLTQNELDRVISTLKEIKK
ncbi:MAG: DegT/DnrJ/EryC1/StrS family aminotransferase [Candidatus Hodarchaeota archaeon]